MCVQEEGRLLAEQGDIAQNAHLVVQGNNKTRANKKENYLFKQALRKNPSASFARKRGMLRRIVRTLLYGLKRKVHLSATLPH